MTDERKRIVDALRDHDDCDMRKKCDGCVREKYCYAENGENLENDAADLIEQMDGEIAQLKNRIADQTHAAIYNNNVYEKLHEENAALLQDLKKAVIAGGTCTACRHSTDKNRERCNSTPKPDGSCWEWRGVHNA